MSLKSRILGYGRSLISSHHSNNASTPESLFTPTDPTVDGDECLHDCDSCTVHLPRSWKIEESDALYGLVKGWQTHLVVATGKTDWVRDVTDESGSIMHAIGERNPGNGKMMLSACNMPVPHDVDSQGSTVLLLPSFTLIEHVHPSDAPSLLAHMGALPTNTSPLGASLASSPAEHPLPPHLTSRPIPHDYLVLLCSHKTRDARCGQSAPLIRRELERHLRPRGLFRDLDDDRPGGVGIYFINHVGGHKYSANVMIYRSARVAAPGGKEVAERAERMAAEANAEAGTRAGAGAGAETGDEKANGDGETAHASNGDAPLPEVLLETKEASQCIWLARVRPEDCENLVRYTILQGKVVKPQRQLRGGFDRAKGLVSW